MTTPKNENNWSYSDFINEGVKQPQYVIWLWNLSCYLEY